MGQVRDFILHHYRHFNAAALVDAAKAWEAHLAKGGKMLLTMGGAMSTGELGLVLAELIRKEKIHGISLTGANLEEDVFNLVAHNSYRRVPNFRELGPKDEAALLERGLNRVTDTCIPEHEAMRKIEKKMLALWQNAHKTE
jgi:deoxyhypusine synthase